jgi:hypothetical protein
MFKRSHAHTADGNFNSFEDIRTPNMMLKVMKEHCRSLLRALHSSAASQLLLLAGSIKLKSAVKQVIDFYR